ncbi:hypothetical protein IHV25_09240 [Phaeovibrio sulfidiphilus]|uniref:Uncharacterized protein n=1 Tax=Phaeovibrio sulfidiphilus TaxID=1220600 RepID=A0A8J7CRU7_9PROT|nr:hypothetical protein [Phaeovibrio sulfidiphilus]MBE1237830.1 hypothetical protein [Phaeovibrio sulfidiphilus]
MPPPVMRVLDVRRHIVVNEVVKPVALPKIRRLTRRVHLLFLAVECVGLFFMVDTIIMIIRVVRGLDALAPILVIPTDQVVSLVLAPMVLSIHAYLTLRGIWLRATRTRLAHGIVFTVLCLYISAIPASTLITSSLSRTAEEYRYVRCQKWDSFKYANLYYGLTDSACRDWRDKMTEP